MVNSLPSVIQFSNVQVNYSKETLCAHVNTHFIKKSHGPRVFFFFSFINVFSIVIIVIILFKFKFNNFLNLYNPHVATLIEAGCISYNKIHYIKNTVHYSKIQKNISLLKSGK